VLVFRSLRVLPILVVLLLPFAASQIPAVRAAILVVLSLMREGSPLGVVLFVVSYAAGAIITAPIWFFSGMAGYAYGPLRGLLVASPAGVIAATTAFLVGRFALSARIQRWTGKSKRWQSIRHAVAEDAFRVAVLLRLTPLAPQNLLSYGLALTSMRVRTFMAATWLGLLPITTFQVYAGSLVHDATELLEGKRPPLGVWSYVATGAGLVATLTAVTVMARLARRALAKAGV
jgi:uncharacterized membrane protein YdjX (TVP38/TMEM64 family)